MDEIQKAIAFYHDEYEATKLYSYLAKIERDAEAKKNYEDLSKIEAEHTAFWHQFLIDRNVKVKPKKANRIKLRLYNGIKKVLGSRLFITLLEAKEATSTKSYYNYLKASSLTEKEKNMLAKIIQDELEHESHFGNQKGAFDIGNIRDFILGMNDGLVEILGTVTGLSAVYPSHPFTVGINGLIVGVAGALSMAIGAFTSVRSQRQVNEGIKSKMELLFSVSKQRAQDELYSKLTQSGIPEDISREVVGKLSENQQAMIGLLTEEVTENEFKSAAYTGLSYILGVVFPVLPFFIISTSSLMSLILSIILAAIALSIVGFVVSIASESLSIKNKAMEMVATGLGAAAISYIFGTIIQTVFGIHI